MSEKNGDKSRYQINRKRGVHRRAKVRAMLAGGGEGQQSERPKRRAKPAIGKS